MSRQRLISLAMLTNADRLRGSSLYLRKQAKTPRSHLTYFQRYWDVSLSRLWMLWKNDAKRDAISCDPWKSVETRIDIRELGWFRVDSNRIHSASHRISRWKDVQLFEYVPIKKSELRYTRFYLPLPAFPAVPALPFRYLSSCLLRSRRSLLLLVFAFRQETGRRDISGFFSSNYFIISFLKH